MGLVRAAVGAQGHEAHVRICMPEGQRASGLCRWLARVARSHPDLGGMRLEFSVFDAPKSTPVAGCRSHLWRR